MPPASLIHFLNTRVKFADWWWQSLQGSPMGREVEASYVYHNDVTEEGAAKISRSTEQWRSTLSSSSIIDLRALTILSFQAVIISKHKPFSRSPVSFQMFLVIDRVHLNAKYCVNPFSNTSDHDVWNTCPFLRTFWISRWFARKDDEVPASQPS